MNEIFEIYLRELDILLNNIVKLTKAGDIILSIIHCSKGKNKHSLNPGLCCIWLLCVFYLLCHGGLNTLEGYTLGML